MNVLFAPDYCLHNPYQQLLAGALADRGCNIQFLSDYRRGLPLTRGCKSRNGLLHLHWPEAYFRSSSSQLAEWIRALRYPLDLALLATRRPVIATAHNLLPHRKSPLAALDMGSTYRRAKKIIAHSETAAARVAEFYRLDRGKIHVIPHGDLAVDMPPLVDQQTARTKLTLGSEPICLIFGALARYKGIEEIAGAWHQTGDSARLYVVGDSFDSSYGDQLEGTLVNTERVTLIRERVDDDALHLWLSACDCTLFNYSRILTSGSACLARSLGVTIVLPDHLQNVDLSEPHRQVFRFDTVDGNFSEIVERAIRTPRRDDDTTSWRSQTAWHRVAAATLEVYREAISPSP